MAVDTMAVDTMAVDTMAVDTMAVDTMAVDTMAVDTMAVDTMAVDIMVVDTMAVDIMVVDIMAVDIMAVDIMAVDIMAVAPNEIWRPVLTVMAMLCIRMVAGWSPTALKEIILITLQSAGVMIVSIPENYGMQIVVPMETRVRCRVHVAIAIHRQSVE
jgi:pentapeptide MXKDX repeat protein